MFGSLALAGAFFFYTAPIKEIPLLFDHAPWLNDPFDTVISFMMFFVPLIGLFCVPRILLCRRTEPLPTARIHDVLRGCRVVLAGISLTLLAEWISVIIKGNRAQWNAATWLQIGLLTLMTVATLVMIGELHRIGVPSVAGNPGTASPDWIADTALLVRRHSQLLGPARRRALSCLDWSERSLVTAMRRHPLWTAVAASAVIGAGVGITQGLREGYFLKITIVACCLLAAGMFGLLVASGSYLGLIRSGVPLRGGRRRLADAAVITCIAILVPFAMRNHLWWMVGSTSAAAGLTQLLQLLAIFTAAIFTVAVAAESLLRLHRQPPAPTALTERLSA